MINSADDIFKAFLQGIRRTSHSTFPPVRFVILWNEFAMREWIEKNESMKEGVELTQKQIDDMRMLRRRYVPSSIIGYVQVPLPYFGGKTLYGYEFMTPELIGGKAVEMEGPYQRMKNVMVKFTDTGFLPCIPLRSDEEGVVQKSYYMNPGKRNSRYFVKENSLFILSGSAYQDIEKVALDYYKYPNQMSYSDGSFTYDIDLPSYQIGEVVDNAIRIYLENRNDPRFQNQLQMEANKSIQKL